MIFFLLLLSQNVHAMHHAPLPVIHERRVPQHRVLRTLVSRPLRHGQQFKVVTTYHRGFEDNILTVVIDENLNQRNFVQASRDGTFLFPSVPIYTIQGTRRDDILENHQSAEDWCALSFPSLR